MQVAKKQKFKKGTKVQVKFNSVWALPFNTLIVEEQVDSGFVYVKKKGGGDEVYPIKAERLEKISNNPFTIFKRFICRAFECSYK